MLAFATAFAVSASSQDTDYLDSVTREAVESLKAEVAATPTDRETARERARLVWTWVNAYSLEGNYVPVNLTQTVSNLLSYPLPAGNARYLELDNYVRELALHEADPGALGTLVAKGGPFEAASFGTLEQTYTVGNRPIQVGGGFLVTKHFMTNHGIYQVNDPSGDNYLTVRSSNTEVEFEFEWVNIRGMHGGFRRPAPTLFARVVGSQLNPGDTVTVTYGDTTEGGRGLRFPTISSDRMPFPIYVALDSTRHFLSLPIQQVEVIGGRVAGVHGFVPSIVKSGDPFTVSIRAQDAFYNRATGEMPAWVVENEDETLATIDSGSNAIHTIEKIVLTEPGVYRFKIRSSDGSISGTTNPVLVEEDPKRRIYWGDTHGHSGFAEGIGSPDQLMRWAREDARLDYVTHSEHDIWMDDFEWNVLKDNVERYSEEGEFIAFLGYEWTVRKFQGGHHNVLFRTTADRKRIPAQTHGTLSRLYQGLREKHQPNDVVVIPHAHQPADYRMNDPELEPLVEIMSQHGTFEWFGRMYLNHGHQVGFIAASDDHLAQPGWTMPRGGSLSQQTGLGALRANTKSRDALFDAMRNLSTYASTGDRIILDFELNGGQMGQRIPFASSRQINGRVIGTAPIKDIAIVKNDEVFWERDYLIDQNAGETSEQTYQLVFYSDSEPAHPMDNPRGRRPWRGTVSLSGAKFAGHREVTPGALEITSESQANLNVITRGNVRSITVDLEEVTEEAEIRLQLRELAETGGIASYRANTPLPSVNLSFQLSELTDGSDRKEFKVDTYTDHISLRRVHESGVWDVQFEAKDFGTRQGDYYYVRVRQANDAIAWSSPIWVGGYPKQ